MEDLCRALSELEDGFKLGNEVESEAHDVRRDKNKVDQSAGILGAMEIERLRYAAGQAAGRQARPRSPVPTAAGLDADLAVKMADKKAALAGLDPDRLRVHHERSIPLPRGSMTARFCAPSSGLMSPPRP